MTRRARRGSASVRDWREVTERYVRVDNGARIYAYTDARKESEADVVDFFTIESLRARKRRSRIAVRRSRALLPLHGGSVVKEKEKRKEREKKKKFLA